MEEMYGIEGPDEFKLVDISATHNLKGLVLCSTDMCQTEHDGASAGCLTMQFECDATVQFTQVYDDKSAREFSEYTKLEVKNA